MPLATHDSTPATLNTLRNAFTHFTPKGWSLALDGLPAICLDVLDLLQFIGWESTSVTWHDRAYVVGPAKFNSGRCDEWRPCRPGHPGCESLSKRRRSYPDRQVDPCPRHEGCQQQAQKSHLQAQTDDRPHQPADVVTRRTAQRVQRVAQ